MTLARFTPSILDGETLEQLFVHRHHLLDDVVSAVREAASGDGRRHRLFVGPRGAGKTHLVSLVNHRVRQARADGLRVGLSWLMEDPWEIESYDDLVSEVLEQAGAERSGGERGLLALAEAGGPIVVLIENLDQIFEQIGADGQRRLRALMENDRPLLIIATSTRLSDDLTRQPVPFYGFFDVTRLEPFSVDEAADMLRQVAEYSEDESLAALLAAPHANARLATISHLAGGQPRVWALLGTGLTDSGIDEMVDMLLARFDDLTPYYQEQLARLSPSERKAVRRLADADRPLTVRDLAELAGTDQRSMSKTVSDLRKRGWVRRHESVLTVHQDARRTYYELAEPLARIAFQVKGARGKPVQLVVNFLSVWFDREDLRIDDDTSSGVAYRRAAMDSAGRFRILEQVLTGRRSTSRVGQATPDNTSVMIESALATFDRDGDATALLQLPAAITGLIEQRLTTLSVTELRLLLAESAVMHREQGDWHAVLEDIAGSTGDDMVRARALAGLVVLNRAAPVGVISALLDQVDEVMAEKAAASIMHLYNWMALGLANWHELPDLIFALADRRLIVGHEDQFIRHLLKWVGAMELIRFGQKVQAERIVNGIFESVVEKTTRATALRSPEAVMLAAILVRIGKARKALMFLDEVDYEFDIASEVRRAALSALDPDRVPDGLGLGEGLEAGDSGLDGP